MSTNNPDTIEGHWTCARCWLHGDEVKSVEVIPAATLTAIVELLAANPTAYAEDILREVEKGDMHLRVGTFDPHNVDPLQLAADESARFAEIVAHERASPADTGGTE